jgi:hypothetical protein
MLYLDRYNEDFLILFLNCKVKGFYQLAYIQKLGEHANYLVYWLHIRDQLLKSRFPFRHQKQLQSENVSSD